MRKLKSKRNGIASKIIQNVPDSCDVKIITNSIQVIDQFIGSPTSCGSSTISLSTQDEELVTSPLRGSLLTMINYANLSSFRSSLASDHKGLSNKIETCGRNDYFRLQHNIILILITKRKKLEFEIVE